MVATLILTVAVNVYQYTLNLELNKQNTQTNLQLDFKGSLAQVQSQIKGELQSLDAVLLDACIQLSSTGLTGTQARALLTQLVDSNSLIVNAATADAHDILLAVEPSSYASIEGQDISSQEQDLYMHQTMRPAMSDMILLVEGFYGVVMVAPVFDSNNQFIGSLSIVIQPYDLIKKYAEPIIEDGTFSLWSMQLNGTLIFDPDPAQQGKNLLTDPIYTDYPEVQAFTSQVVAQNTGYGTYSYYDKDLSDSSGKVVNKEACWTTIGLYTTQWRLVIVHAST
ncbi:MAG: PDC sensor domain-containing protein [Candidatus Bathyarchaeia archaeon]